MRQLPDFTTRNGNKMKIYKIKRIEEADYGCEERPEGYVPKVTVYLEDVAGAHRPFWVYKGSGRWCFWQGSRRDEERVCACAEDRKHRQTLRFYQ